MKTSQEKIKSYVCFDWGTRHIGVAVSPDGKHVFERAAFLVTSESQGLETMERFLKSENCSNAVFGLPLALSGQEGRMAQLVRKVAEQLRQMSGCTVYFQDERMSSQGATKVGKRQNDRERQHSIAAAHVLETFLKL